MSDKDIIVPNAPDEHWLDIVEQITSELTDDVPEKVVRATEMLLSGFPMAKVAKEVGVTQDTVKSWIRKYPTVAKVLAEGKHYLHLWRMAKLEQQFLKAVEQSDKILDLDLEETGVNAKLVATVAQHARFVMGLFAGQKIDISVQNTAEDPVLRAKADALDYIAAKLQESRERNDTVTVSYHVIDANEERKKLLLGKDGNPMFGELGVLDTDETGALCHICGKREQIMGVHISRDHDMRVREYETIFLLDDGTIEGFDGRGKL